MLRKSYIGIRTAGRLRPEIKFVSQNAFAGVVIKAADPSAGVESFGSVIFTTDLNYAGGTGVTVSQLSIPTSGLDNGKYIGREFTFLYIDLTFVQAFATGDSDPPNPNLIRLYMISNRLSNSYIQPSGKNLPMRFGEPIDTTIWRIHYEKVYSTDTGATGGVVYHNQSRRKYFRMKIPYRVRMRPGPTQSAGVANWLQQRNVFVIMALQDSCQQHIVRDTYWKAYYVDN